MPYKGRLALPSQGGHDTMDWPAISSDFNAIEHVLNCLKTVRKLYLVKLKEWDAIPHAT